MADIKIIEKILFNANIDGRWYNKVQIPINANNGYTNEDIDTKDDTIFSCRIGKDNYDIRVFKNLLGRYSIKATLLERNENADWVKAKEQKNIRINNVKVKFCENNFH